MESHEHSEKCREIFSLLSDYLDLDLPPDACQEIDAHLAGCPPCVEFAESLRKTVDLCRQYQSTELPAPMAEQAKAELLETYRRVLAVRTSRQ